MLLLRRRAVRNDLRGGGARDTGRHERERFPRLHRQSDHQQVQHHRRKGGRAVIDHIFRSVSTASRKKISCREIVSVGPGVVVRVDRVVLCCGVWVEPPYILFNQTACYYYYYCCGYGYTIVLAVSPRTR